MLTWLILLLQIGDPNFEVRERVRYTRDQLLELREVLAICCVIQYQFLDGKFAVNILVDMFCFTCSLSFGFVEKCLQRIWHI
jgi:hypothetical protein